MFRSFYFNRDEGNRKTYGKINSGSRDHELWWKVKQSRYRPEQAQGVDTGIALPFHDLGTRRGCVVSITPQPLYPSTHCTGGWVGAKASLDVCEKSHPPLGFNPWTVQPVASRYTDWAITNYGSFLIIRSVLLLMLVIIDISVSMNHHKCLNYVSYFGEFI
jgi:hypothetical protein